MNRSRLAALLVVSLFLASIAGIYAQDFGFGFGSDSDEEAGAETSAPPLSVKVGGEIAARLMGFVHDFDSLGDVVSGKLNFSAAGSNADAFIGFNLSAASFGDLANHDWEGSPNYIPRILDEAYVRAFFGPVNIEAGLRKLTWGKADSLGPLDIVNPLDYSDLTNITDIQAIKIARPMVHLSLNTGAFSKAEAVFLPNFAGHRFAQNGRWVPSQYSTMPAVAEAGIFARAKERYGALVSGAAAGALFDGVRDNLVNSFDVASVSAEDSNRLKYFQAGLRFTTTIRSADIGAQYFYGNLFRPDFSIEGVDAFIDDLVDKISADNTYMGDPSLLSPQINYTRYHQIGLDYAQVLFGLNLRGEFAVHLTEDLDGDDGSVHNPFLAWSLGFDRDLFWGINANIQCNETIRLFNDKVGKNPAMDCEADTDMTATRLTVQLSKKFLRDNLETKATAIWDIESSGCYVIPAIVWIIGDVSTELSAGIFAGKDSGELGQYWENSYVKAGLKYSF